MWNQAELEIVLFCYTYIGQYTLMFWNKSVETGK